MDSNLISFLVKSHDEAGQYLTSLKSLDFNESGFKQFVSPSVDFLFESKGEYLAARCEGGHLKFFRITPTTRDPHGRALCERILLEVPENIASSDDVWALLSAESLNDKAERMASSGRTVSAKPIRTRLDNAKSPRFTYKKRIFLVAVDPEPLLRQFAELCVHMKEGSVASILVARESLASNPDGSMPAGLDGYEIKSAQEFEAEFLALMNRLEAVVSPMGEAWPEEAPALDSRIGDGIEISAVESSLVEEGSTSSEEELLPTFSEQVVFSSTASLPPLPDPFGDASKESHPPEWFSLGDKQVLGDAASNDGSFLSLPPVAHSAENGDEMSTGTVEGMVQEVGAAAESSDASTIGPSSSGFLLRSVSFVRYQEAISQKNGRRRLFRSAKLIAPHQAIFDFNKSIYNSLQGRGIGGEVVGRMQVLDLLVTFHQAEMKVIGKSEFVDAVKVIYGQDCQRGWGHMMKSVMAFMRERRSAGVDDDISGEVLEFLCKFASLVGEVIVRYALTNEARRSS